MPAKFQIQARPSAELAKGAAITLALIILEENADLLRVIIRLVETRSAAPG